MKSVKCTCGKDILLDDEDHEKLCVSVWFCNPHTTPRRQVKDIQQPIGDAILGHVFGFVVDHINRNNHDNQKHNLCHATRSQNGANRGLQTNNTSGYKGVYFDKTRKRWVAELKVNGKKLFIGRFRLLNNAVNAFNTEAAKHHGEFAQLNIIPL